MHGLSQLAAALCALAVTATAGAAPARVVTLAPHATELVYAAGAGNQIVGTVTSSDYPEQARQLPRVGDGILLNQERLLLLAPTHIIAWQRFGAAVPAELLANRMNAQMLYSAPRTLRELPAEVKRIGALLGTQAAADRTAAAMLARIDTLEARHAGREPVRVFIEVGSLPLYTIGSDPLLNDALRTCGAVNVYGDSALAAPKVPVESVLVHDPQLIVAPAREARDTHEVRQRWAEIGLAAARRGHVHAADPDALFRPGPRLIDATEALCSAVDQARADTSDQTATAQGLK